MRDGRREGVWTTWSEDGRKQSQCSYHMGVPWGEFIRWDASGGIEERGGYVDGKKDGVWASKDSNGAISIVTYRNGEYVPDAD